MNECLIEKKSKKFLKDIIGEEHYNKLVKNKKIEIESGNNVYQLNYDGTVINKTTNQKYCIVPERVDYPHEDILAIKWTWLRHGISVVEKVANKTRIDTYADVHTYDEFVHAMHIDGYNREYLIIDEYNNTLATTYSIDSGWGQIIKIKCPAGRIITTGGFEQGVSYKFTLDIRDVNGDEIPSNTRIIFEKVTSPSECIVALCQDLYSLLNLRRKIKTEIGNVFIDKTDNELWRWRGGIILYPEQVLKVSIRDYNKILIPVSNIKFNMELDMFVRR